jgi:hypothetical protein
MEIMLPEQGRSPVPFNLGDGRIPFLIFPDDLDIPLEEGR